MCMLVISSTLLLQQVQNELRSLHTARLYPEEGKNMCWMCDQGKPQLHRNSLYGRRDFLKASTAAGIAAAGFSLFTARPASAASAGDPPLDSGRPGRRYIIRGGAVMSMDPKVGDFAKADVLVEGK